MTHQEAIEKNGYIIVSPISASMRPLIRENVDFARFESAVSRKPKVSDVVLYPGYGAFEGKVIMHRIIGTIGDDYVIQGDNSPVWEIIPKAAIFGVMTGYFRGDRYRSCKNPVFQLHSLFIITERRTVYFYRTSPLIPFKAARFLWRKILHNRFFRRHHVQK